MSRQSYICDGKKGLSVQPSECSSSSRVKDFEDVSSLRDLSVCGCPAVNSSRSNVTFSEFLKKKTPFCENGYVT